MTQNDPATVAQAYLDAWKANDWLLLRSLLADDATFEGPLASLQGADTLVEGLQGMARIMTDIVVHKRFVDGPDVLTWFDLHTSVAPPAPTANWSYSRTARSPRSASRSTPGRSRHLRAARPPFGSHCRRCPRSVISLRCLPPRREETPRR